MLFSSIAYLSKSKRFLCNALHRSSIAEPLDAVLLLRDAEPGKSFAIRSCAIPPSRFLRHAYPRNSTAWPRLSALSPDRKSVV